MKEICALQDGNTILYVVGVYHGHVFRKYPDGHLGKANAQEREIVGSMK